MTTIKVATIFEKGKLKPVWFIHEARKYPVKEISYEWISKNGASKLYHFAVSDGTNTYSIYFDDRNMKWELDEERS